MYGSPRPKAPLALAHGYTLSSHAIEPSPLQQGAIVARIRVRHTVWNLSCDSHARSDFMHNYYTGYQLLHGDPREAKTRELDVYYRWDGGRWVFDPAERSRELVATPPTNGRGPMTVLPRATGIRNMTVLAFPFCD